MGEDLSVTLHASGAETVSGNGSALDLQSDSVTLRRAAVVTLGVSAVTGTLTVLVDTSADGVSWDNLGTFVAATTVGVQELRFGDCKRYLRCRWTIVTGPATFSCAAVAKQTFCSLTDLVALGGAADILTASVTTSERLLHLASVSAYARGYLAKAGLLPILAVGQDVALAVAQITVVDIITSDTGPHPDEEATALLLAAADRARKWLQDVAAGRVVPDVTFTYSEDVVDADPEGFGGGAVYGDAQRTWSNALP